MTMLPLEFARMILVPVYIAFVQFILHTNPLLIDEQP